MTRLLRALRRHLPAGHLDRYGNQPHPFAAPLWEPSEQAILW